MESLCLGKSNWLNDLADTTQSLPRRVSTFAGADHDNK